MVPRKEPPCCLDKSWVSKDFILLSETFVKGHICGFLYALTLWPFHCAVSDQAGVVCVVSLKEIRLQAF